MRKATTVIDEMDGIFVVGIVNDVWEENSNEEDDPDHSLWVPIAQCPSLKEAEERAEWVKSIL